MKCAPFDYVRASSVEEVIKTLADGDGDGKILAGGQSLVGRPGRRPHHDSGGPVCQRPDDLAR
jgi:CO/xanthine dehydrogenase FAD-binding subunit